MNYNQRVKHFAQSNFDEEISIFCSAVIQGKREDLSVFFDAGARMEDFTRHGKCTVVYILDKIDFPAIITDNHLECLQIAFQAVNKNKHSRSKWYNIFLNRSEEVIDIALESELLHLDDAYKIGEERKNDNIKQNTLLQDERRKRW